MFAAQDIWSLGISFCEMATAKAPFKNAAAAIFAACVSKEYPALPEDVSKDAVSFLARHVLPAPLTPHNTTAPCMLACLLASCLG